jgi:hypothetical protein
MMSNELLVGSKLSELTIFVVLKRFTREGHSLGNFLVSRKQEMSSERIYSL